MKGLNILIAAVIPLIMLALPAIADEIEGGSAVDEVTVYRERALVVRLARIDILPGEHVYRFGPLPSGLLDETVTVRGEGSVRMQIAGVETQRVFPGEAARERVRELENRIASLQRDVDRKSAELESLESERQFLNSIRVYTGEQMGKELAGQVPDIRRWESTLEYLRTKHDENRATALHKTVEREAILKEIERLKNELQQLAGGRRNEAKQVSVRIAAHERGTLMLRLSYVVPGASWQAVYDARAAAGSDEVRISYNASVLQRTGEDWLGANIVLSTAQPAAGGRMPMLHPWYLGIIAPPRPAMIREKGLDDMEQDQKMMSAIVETAVVEEQVTSMLFRVPGRQTIPGDGSAHRMFINEYLFTGAKEYISTPKLTSNAYLTVKTSNTSGAALLPGAMNVYLGADYVGRSSLAYTAPDEEIELFLGIDESIRIVRTEVSRKVDEGSFLSRRKKTDLGYKIEIGNNKSQPVKITIVDQLPVSQHSDIEVRLTGISPEPVERSDQGMLKWTIDLLPGAKREITFGYYIRHPFDMNVAGY